EDDRRKIEYRLTAKGFDLLPAMIALRQWGQKYGSEFVSEDPVLVDERDRLPIGPVSVLSHDGRILNHEELNLIKRSDLGKRTDGTVAHASRALAKGDVIDLDQLKSTVTG
ncbi:MAG: winged helix-turn-helix transcriptional regulator, partial [Pseudomonadota bacterium]